MEMKKLLESLQKLEECPPEMAEGPMAAPAPMDQGNPVTVNVSMNASGKEHVADLMRMMQQAGLGDAKPVSQDMMPMRQDMERLRAIVDEPGDEDPREEDLEMEDYENEPEEEYHDHELMTKDLSGGINREKKAYKAAQDGDNAMAVEDIAKELYAALAEKKAKPDFLDMDKDGDKEEPMKKALKDKKDKKTNESELDEISSDLAKRYTKAAKMDRDFNDDDIDRLSKSGQSTRDMHKRNAKRTKGINRAAKRIEK